MAAANECRAEVGEVFERESTESMCDAFTAEANANCPLIRHVIVRSKRKSNVASAVDTIALADGGGGVTSMPDDTKLIAGWDDGKVGNESLERRRWLRRREGARMESFVFLFLLLLLLCEPPLPQKRAMIPPSPMSARCRPRDASSCEEGAPNQLHISRA